MSMKYQRGVSLSGLLMGAVVVALVALVGMRAIPEWMEYGKLVKVVKATAGDASLREATLAQVRTAYQKRAEIDDIKSMSADDLDISKENGQLVIKFAYEKKVPLFSNISLVFDFEGSSDK
jgi:hypothetical protein